MMEYGCIGEKLSHSFSKIIHNELCGYDYELKEVSKQELDSFMRKADFKAINVTIPYKQDVIPYLYYIEDTAQKIGAVNTIVNRDGKLYGYNTDFKGLSALIKQNGISLRNKKVLILGSGGTSKTAHAVAQSMNADKIFRVSRGGIDGTITYAQAEKEHSDADIIINTTPCGMFPNIGSTAVNIEKFPNLKGVVDAVYNPLSSALVINAKERGITAVGGLYMLVAQAVYAAEIFTGKEIAESEIERIFKKIKFSQQNIVLVGMPGCGKTTIGKAVAQQLNKTFIDTDDEIIKATGKTIPEIFLNFGEQEFRRIESEQIKKVSAMQTCVIATGGGAVLNRENVRLLKENGMIFFIDRPIEDILPTADRPLSSDRNALKKRYDERYQIYCDAADFTIKAVMEITENINKIKEVFISENTCN